MQIKFKLFCLSMILFCSSTVQSAVIYDFTGVCNSGQGCTSPTPITAELTLIDGYSNSLEVSDIESFIYTGINSFIFVQPPAPSGQRGITSASGDLPLASGPAAISIVGFNSHADGNWDLFVGNGANFANSGTEGIWTLRSSVVPIPAAAWLFGTGLLSLVSIARRKSSITINLLN